jgi:hypothetical protein
MWKPKQMLSDVVITTLRQAGLSEMQIEYLGWMSGTATAINNSMNPAKAAGTILGRALNPTKPGKNGDTRSMLEKFIAKKKASVQIEVDLNQVNQKFRKFDTWAEELEAESTPHKNHALDEE